MSSSEPSSASGSFPPPQAAASSTTTTSLSSPRQPSLASPRIAPSTTTSLSSPGLINIPPPLPALSTTSTSASVLHQTLPSPDQQRHVAEARAAVVASIGNILDSELQSRATMLHANAAAISRQERDVVRATDGLRRENDKLAKWSGDAARRVKELGNVQNWAEVLERDFLVLEETMRLVREGSSGSCGSWSGSGSRSGSWSGSDDGGDGGARVDGDGDVRMAEDMEPGGARLAPDSPGKGKGKGVDDVYANTLQNAAEDDPSGEAQGRVQGTAATSLSITI
ncbi:hypothetical protein HYQ45_001885 [Verticillium longisporum]|uniref:Biogenesis of lysosome-related organelles complex 1 subunit 1 n=1 Tax=Verticillium longisporum TaxID=100787 RepID=A0A8I3A096_VERLO|nr:hypothetical protein HYQ44_010033 [Verticillium longisporum]KAG7141465.1 hypothetical protein HYQ45_001885 [Verticillium longisporum]